MIDSLILKVSLFAICYDLNLYLLNGVAQLFTKAYDKRVIQCKSKRFSTGCCTIRQHRVLYYPAAQGAVLSGCTGCCTIRQQRVLYYPAEHSAVLSGRGAAPAGCYTKWVCSLWVLNYLFNSTHVQLTVQVLDYHGCSIGGLYYLGSYTTWELGAVISRTNSTSFKLRPYKVLDALKV